MGLESPTKTFLRVVRVPAWPAQPFGLCLDRKPSESTDSLAHESRVPYRGTQLSVVPNPGGPRMHTADRQRWIIASVLDLTEEPGWDDEPQSWVGSWQCGSLTEQVLCLHLYSTFLQTGNTVGSSPHLAVLPKSNL